ncbi:MAG: hypothetical protein AAGD38_24870 [Acidobacteriota bacterium]
MRTVKAVAVLAFAFVLMGSASLAQERDAWTEVQPGVHQIEEGSKTLTLADGAQALPWIRAHFESRVTELTARYLENPSNELWQAITLGVAKARQAAELEKTGGPVSTHAPFTRSTEFVFAYAFRARSLLSAYAIADYENPSVSADIYTEAFSDPSNSGGFTSCSDSGLDVECNSSSAGFSPFGAPCEADAYAEIWIPSTSTLISISDSATDCN